MRPNLRPVILLTGLTLVISACKIYYTPEKVVYQASTGDRGEGKRVTMLMCGPCHYDVNTKKYTGLKMDDVPGFVGKVYAKNITRDIQVGAGSYSDAEMAYLIKTGVARDGKLMPYMQRPNISEHDLKDIIAYLKSDDELVAASTVNPGKTRYTPMGRFGISKTKPLSWKNESPQKPGPDDPLLLGKYLVDNLACYDCHSQSFMGLNKENPEESKGYLGGGNKLKDRSGKTIAGPNLTAHATGILEWTETDFLKAMKQGISKDNSIITFPMPMYSDLTNEEVKSIFLYLRSVKPVDHKIKRSN